MTSVPPAKEFTGKKAMMWIVGFFLVIFTVNAIMATVAVGTWGGLETDNAYRKGLFYNNEIAAAEDQHKSGWTIALSHRPTAMENDRIGVKITWPENDLPPVQVSVLITRAVTNAYDQEIILTNAGDNIYTAAVKFAEPGQWDVDVIVKRSEGPVYQLTDKIFVPKR
ncbi:MAG: FixH family protein [Alphaproteobacteria bacterium]|nr:FixH family protein [Alphaproteobacteria bacterium]